MTGLRHGIDLGGTKTEIVTLDAAGGEIFRQRTPTPRGDYGALVGHIAGLVGAAEAACGGIGTVGIGIPGAISPATGLIKNANTTELIGHDLAGDLGARLGRPIRLANDADCFTLSEAADGAGAGGGTVFGVIIGTGVGGGVAVGGRLLSGPNAIAGEWGHNPLPRPADDERPGPACYCGRHGCIETFLSGPGFALDHRQHSGNVMTGREIAAAAAEGDFAAQESIERYCRRLARALATAINLLDPHVIVLGGGMSNLDAIYGRVPALIGRHVFSDTCVTPVRKARHGDSSGVRGAAWLWPAA
ncbi:ROK family protein [Zavarzinia compransoris]|uniref:Fructokinase n=1 Tax=Zavarzinia compransoris TaxID=1264899 RepID=A0A317E8E4_9PROT|nr:ROK family protein [Zavarzinia compransoris]PWR23428.1 fructokinase [Zavarzinia compransoris]TDP45996.1 N-acetylglucosamine kinase [Zavarzinia compransoris]